MLGQLWTLGHEPDSFKDEQSKGASEHKRGKENVEDKVRLSRRKNAEHANATTYEIEKGYVERHREYWTVLRQHQVGGKYRQQYCKDWQGDYGDVVRCPEPLAFRRNRVLNMLNCFANSLEISCSILLRIITGWCRLSTRIVHRLAIPGICGVENNYILAHNYAEP